MTERDTFNRGVMAGLLAMIGGQAVHWFLTPMSHPDATSLRVIGVAVQAVLGFGGACLVMLRSRAAQKRRRIS